MKKQLLILGLSLFMTMQTLAANNIEVVTTNKSCNITVNENSELIGRVTHFRKTVIQPLVGNKNMYEIADTLLDMPEEQFDRLFKETIEVMKTTVEIARNLDKLTINQRERYVRETKAFDSWVDVLITVNGLRS